MEGSEVWETFTPPLKARSPPLAAEGVFSLLNSTSSNVSLLLVRVGMALSGFGGGRGGETSMSSGFNGASWMASELWKSSLPGDGGSSFIAEPFWIPKPTNSDSDDSGCGLSGGLSTAGSGLGVGELSC